MKLYVFLHKTDNDLYAILKNRKYFLKIFLLVFVFITLDHTTFV